MSTTVTGSPPQGQVASHRRTPAGQATSRPRRGFHLPRASTTPGGLWLVRAGLVIACLAWGALATLMVIQHSSAVEAAISADQSVFTSNAAAGSDAFTALEAGITVATLVMAVGCGGGLTRRLAEYR